MRQKWSVVAKVSELGRIAVIRRWRWWCAAAGIVSLAPLLMAQAATGRSDGLVVLRSNADFATTLARVEPAVRARELFVMRVIDHADSAAQFGRELAPNTVVLFGNPQVGSQLMACEPRVGIDLPQKLLIWEADGAVMVAYNDPAYLVRRHAIAGCGDLIGRVTESLRAISAQVSGGESGERQEATTGTTQELRRLYEADQEDRRPSTPPT